MNYIIINIFVLDEDPKLAAQYHCNKHVVKMIVETAQLLSSAYYYTKQSNLAPYSLISNPKHPCCIWARESLDNWCWLMLLGLELYREYKHRYFNRVHKSGEAILYMLNNLPNLPEKGITQRPLSMPDDCKIIGDVVESYRLYYKRYKTHILYYTNRDKPPWL